MPVRSWGPPSGAYAMQYGPRYAEGEGGKQLQQQQEQQPHQHQHQSPDVMCPKIMRTMGNTGVCILFIVMTTRALQLYEMADQLTGVGLRYVVVAPTMALVCGNVLGVLLSVAQSFARNQRLKRRLKALLTLDGAVEVGVLLHSLLRLLVGADGWTPKETYVGQVVHSMWMLILISIFVSTRWDAGSVVPSRAFN